MKQIFLMRHGDALHHAPSDSARPLSELGEREVSAAAERLGELAVELDTEIQIMVSSPFRRARETASIVRQQLNPDWLTRTNEGITPDVAVEEALQVIATTMDNVDTALFVTHQPIISRLIRYLSGVEQPMGTSAVALLEGDLIERECCNLRCVL